ncbi:MAG: centromere/microtubule-binding protein cbf5 [Bathelium mastoideum]|nr:MAG: centromere/microtubule-binding protein cbf5 [Bathelium mastoideum]
MAPSGHASAVMTHAVPLLMDVGGGGYSGGYNNNSRGGIGYSRGPHHARGNDNGPRRTSYQHLSPTRALIKEEQTRLELAQLSDADFSIDPKIDEGADSQPNQIEFGNNVLLLRGLSKMSYRAGSWTPIADSGYEPLLRPMEKYLEYGVINVDKPPNPSSHEVVAWVKKALGGAVSKVGHSGTLDPKVTGSLIVCLGNATRLVKAQQTAGKTYMCVARLHEDIEGGEEQVLQAFGNLTGPSYQRPPVISAVKRQLRVRAVERLQLLEYNPKMHLVSFLVDCEAGTYIRTLCIHLGYLLGVGAHMQELRRIRSGRMTEDNNMSSLHAVRESFVKFTKTKDSRDLRVTVLPLEVLCLGYPRIIIKDTAVSAVCHGAKLTASGVIRYDNNIAPNMEIVLVSTKGEAIAIAIALKSSEHLPLDSHGHVARVKRGIMDRALYPKRWGTGPYAQFKKDLIKKGELDSRGRAKADTSENVKQWLHDPNTPLAGAPPSQALGYTPLPPQPNGLPDPSNYLFPGSAVPPSSGVIAGPSAGPSYSGNFYDYRLANQNQQRGYGTWPVAQHYTGPNQPVPDPHRLQLGYGDPTLTLGPNPAPNAQFPPPNFNRFSGQVQPVSTALHTPWSSNAGNARTYRRNDGRYGGPQYGGQQRGNQQHGNQPNGR